MADDCFYWKGRAQFPDQINQLFVLRMLEGQVITPFQFINFFVDLAYAWIDPRVRANRALG